LYGGKQIAEVKAEKTVRERERENEDALEEQKLARFNSSGYILAAAAIEMLANAG
jgi:hypothetical protein